MLCPYFKNSKNRRVVYIKCNHQCAEKVKNLLLGQTSPNRHDLVVTIYKIKLSILMNHIISGELFDKILSFVYSFKN